MARRGLVAGPGFEYFRRRYFTPTEVAQHNRPEDLWVSYLGCVYNLTPLAQEYKGNLLLKPIVEVAGQDISHWFDPKTRDVIQRYPVYIHTEESTLRGGHDVKSRG